MRCHLTRILSKNKTWLINSSFLNFHFYIFTQNFGTTQMIFLRSWYAILLVVTIPFDWCITLLSLQIFFYICIVVAFAHSHGARSLLRVLLSTVTKLNSSLLENILQINLKIMLLHYFDIKKKQNFIHTDLITK